MNKMIAKFSIDKLVGKELTDKLRVAQKALDAVILEVTQEARKQPEVSLMLHATEDSGLGGTTSITVSGGYIIVQGPTPFAIVREESNAFAPARNSIDPKLLNSLLHSKFLTEAEKKQLLREQGLLK